VWQAGGNIAPYITRQVNLNSYFLMFIMTCFNVTINTYIALPLMLSQFGEWLNMPRPTVRPVKKTSQGVFSRFRISFKFLDVGLSFELKILFVLVYVAVNVMLGYA
jgi:hypothetical protein